MFAVLYYAAPNVKQRGFRWVTPGALLALVLWLVASAAFAFYVANFGSYDKTYGTLGGAGLPPRVDVDHQRRAAARHGAQRRARAQPRAGRRGARRRPRAAARAALEPKRQKTT